MALPSASRIDFADIVCDVEVGVSEDCGGGGCKQMQWRREWNAMKRRDVQMEGLVVRRK